MPFPSKSLLASLLVLTLVNAHLIRVPRVRTLAIGRFASCNLKGFCRQTDGTLDTELFVFSAIYKLLADFLDGFYIARCQGDADFMDLGTVAKVLAVFIFGLSAMHAVPSRCGSFGHTIRHISESRWLIEVFGGCGRMSDKGLKLQIRIA